MDKIKKQQLKEQRYVELLERWATNATVDLLVTDVRKISRSDALEIARAHGKDWQNEKAFHQKNEKGHRIGFIGVQNGGATDLLEIFYAAPEGNSSGSVFVGYSYNRDLADYYDFNVGDVISIFGDKGRAVCVFNHATNCITSCFDAKHISLHPNTGIDVHDRNQKVMQQIWGAIYHLKGKGLLTNQGATPRAKRDGVAYQYQNDPPYQSMIIGGGGLAGAYVLYTQYNAFLVTFALALVVAAGYYIHNNWGGGGA